MFELGRKPSQVIFVLSLDQKSQKSQRISVPTDRQTLLMHRYLLIESHRRSVGTPLKSIPPSVIRHFDHFLLSSNIPPSNRIAEV